MEKEQAQRLAEEWYGAWNDHDLERILSHYSDDVVFVSPFAASPITGRHVEFVRLCHTNSTLLQRAKTRLAIAGSPICSKAINLPSPLYAWQPPQRREANSAAGSG